MSDIKFKSGNLNLRGNLFTPQENMVKYPAILFVHGWLSNKIKDSEYSKKLFKLGYVCMVFDLGGHGQSEGEVNKISRKEYVQEVVDAYDFLSSLKSVDKMNIHLVCSSFGCYLAAILSGKRKVKSFVLRAPQNYPDEGYSEPKVKLQGSKLKDWRENNLRSDDTKSIRKLKKFSGKVLLLESEHDKYVPKEVYKKYKNAISKKNLSYKFLKDFQHSIKSEMDKKRYVDILKQWFGDRLSPK